jgi:8-oxo-dGTP pyrophosphatase MutT (NUDIX family)
MEGSDWWSHADGSISHDDGESVSDKMGTTPPDPAAGTWEFPGGCLEDSESPVMGAVREWQEETGLHLPDGRLRGKWLSSNGKYRGFVYEVPTEDSVQIGDSRDDVMNPDDPDGDEFESLAWWDVDHLQGNPAIRAELLADLPLVLAALAAGQERQS